MHRLIYILRQTLLLVKESKKIALASIVFLIIGMLTLGSTYIIGQKLFQTSFSLKQKINITVFFKVDAVPSDILNTVDAVKLIDGVKSVELKTSEQAKDDFISLYPQYKEFLSSLKRNPIPYTATIYLTNNSNGDKIQSVIKTFPTVDTVIFSGDTAQKINNLSALIWSLFVAILVVVIAEFTFTIQSSVSFLVDFRKSEIKILQLIGADKLFIEIPFILIASLLSTIAWAISSYVLTKVDIWSNSIVQGLLPFSTAITSVNLRLVSLALLALGLFISLLGSLGPLRRQF
ncbi:MAG: cell division protein FtsX [Caldisericaceae bacterium]